MSDDLFKLLDTLAVKSSRDTEEDEFTFSTAAPGDSHDLRRILALPEKTPYPEDIVERYTERFRKPNGTMTLRPLQAQALYEAEHAGGLVAFMPVGEGKTLTALLLHHVLKATKTVLLTPATLKPQILNFLYPEYQVHWVLPALGVDLVVYSYEELSSQKKRNLLEVEKATNFVLDEAHKVAGDSRRTQRFNRHLRKHGNSSLCLLSASLLKRSIKDVSRLSGFALKSSSPYPLNYGALEQWAGVLDPAVEDAYPGELVKLCRPGEDVRTAFRRRVSSTRGVLMGASTKLDTALNIYTRPLEVPPEVQAALTELRETWALGDVEITETLEFYRYARQVAAGFYYRRTWPRGESREVQEEWSNARSEWFSEARRYLKRPEPEFDSFGLLEEAARQGRYSSEAWDRWVSLKDTAQPSRETIWISDYLVRDAVEWGKEHPGLIWYSHREIGEAIAKLGGFPLYDGGPGSTDAILRERGDRAIVLSENAHKEGINVQHIFSENLITTPPALSETWDQTLGRTHRPGQKRDEVDAWVYLHTEELRDAFDKALAKARWITKMENKTPKLSYAARSF